MTGDAPAPQACTVKHLIIEPKPDRPRRLAILDRDIEVARGLAVGLVELDYEATAFATQAQLEAALQFEGFDGYMMDGVLSTGTAEALIAKLRSQRASCPIGLVADQEGTAAEDEKALVAAIQQHRLHFLQEPVAPSIVASQLSSAFSI